MYKFVMIQGSCGSPYNIKKAEDTSNKMAEQGYRLVEAYQSTTAGCGSTNSVLVLVFERDNAK